MNLMELAKYLNKLIEGSDFAERVFFAGGAVRDFLLGLESKDIDICVEMDNGGIALAEYLASRLGTAAPIVYASFGTALLVYKGLNIEFVMTRAESYRGGSRKPSVVFAPLLQDVMRRDFTVNSLLMDISSGEVLDLCGKGREDLANGVIRCVGEPFSVFKEDPLRILRAYRFCAQLGFDIEQQTQFALQDSTHLLKQISTERIAEEINKLLCCPQLREAFTLMDKGGIFELLLPEVARLKEIAPNKYHHLNAFEHSLLVCYQVKPNLLSRWAALLHDIGKYDTMTISAKGVHYIGHERRSAEISDAILQRYMISKPSRSLICKAIAKHMSYKQSGEYAEKLKELSLRRLAIESLEYKELLLDLIEADNLSHAPEYRLPEQIPALRKKLSETEEMLHNKRFNLTGRDLIEVFSIKSGPKVGEMLAFAHEQWLQNPHLGSERLLSLVAKRFKLR